VSAELKTVTRRPMEYIANGELIIPIYLPKLMNKSAVSKISVLLLFLCS